MYTIKGRPKTFLVAPSGHRKSGFCTSLGSALGFDARCHPGAGQATCPVQQGFHHVSSGCWAPLLIDDYGGLYYPSYVEDHNNI